jgi:TonB family protein
VSAHVKRCVILALISFGLAAVTPATGGQKSRASRDTQDTQAIADFNTCSRPKYPVTSLRNEEQGTVTLRFLIGASGSVNDAVIERSSGSIALDEAALEGIKLCTFVAGRKNGRAIESWMQMQYVWTMDDDPVATVPPRGDAPPGIATNSADTTANRRQNSAALPAEDPYSKESLLELLSAGSSNKGNLPAKK